MKKNQKGNTTFLVLALILLISGIGFYFYNKQKVEEVKVEDVNVNSTVSTTTDTIENKIISNEVSSIKLEKGQYIFDEAVTGMGWVYELNIKNDGGLGLNRLNVDGHMTLLRMYVNGSKNEDGSIDMILDSYGPDNITEPYKKYDILFTLRPSEKGFLIEWKKMLPNLDPSKDNAVFIKTPTPKPIYSKNGLSLNLPSGWKVKIDEGRYGKNCDYFTFTPPNYKYEFFGGFDLCFGKTSSNINDWIVKNASEYKNKVNISKSNYSMGNKDNYFISEIEDENTGIPFYTNVVLGSKSSYEYHFSQDGANDFPEIISKNIFTNIIIE